MTIKESIEQMESLVEAWQLNEADLNQTDINAIKYLLKNIQELIDYLKEKIEACDKYIKIHKKEIAGVINISNENRHLILIKILSAEKDVYEKILNKIEKR